MTEPKFCSYHDCTQDAAYTFQWPGHDNRSAVCREHVDSLLLAALLVCVVLKLDPVPEVVR